MAKGGKDWYKQAYRKEGQKIYKKAFAPIIKATQGRIGKIAKSYDQNRANSAARQGRIKANYGLVRNLEGERARKINDSYAKVLGLQDTRKTNLAKGYDARMASLAGTIPAITQRYESLKNAMEVERDKGLRRMGDQSQAATGRVAANQAARGNYGGSMENTERAATEAAYGGEMNDYSQGVGAQISQALANRGVEESQIQAMLGELTGDKANHIDTVDQYIADQMGNQRDDVDAIDQNVINHWLNQGGDVDAIDADIGQSYLNQGKDTDDIDQYLSELALNRLDRVDAYEGNRKDWRDRERNTNASIAASVEADRLARESFGLDAELGRGNLALDRDRFGFEQETGRDEMNRGWADYGLDAQNQNWSQGFQERGFDADRTDRAWDNNMANRTFDADENQRRWERKTDRWGNEIDRENLRQNDPGTAKTDPASIVQYLNTIMSGEAGPIPSQASLSAAIRNMGGDPNKYKDIMRPRGKSGLVWRNGKWVKGKAKAGGQTNRSSLGGYGDFLRRGASGSLGGLFPGLTVGSELYNYYNRD